MGSLAPAIKKIFTTLLLFAGFSGNCQPGGQMLNVRIGYKQLHHIAAGDSVNNLAEAGEYFSAGKYSESLHPDLNLGIAKDNYWVTFAVTNHSAQKKDFYINLENPRLNDVSVYILRDKVLVAEYRMGDNYPFEQRTLHQNFFAFPLHFDTACTQRVFLFIKHKGNTLQVPIKLLSGNSFQRSIENNYLLTGITTGVLFLTVFFGLFFYMQSANSLFFLYALYTFFLWAWLWSTEGFAFQYLYPHVPDWATRLGPAMSVLAAVFFIACCLKFCQPYDSSSRIRKVLKVCMYLAAAWATIPFLPFLDISSPTNMKTYLTIHFFLNICSILLLVAYLLWVSISKNRVVWYYFAAVFISMACSFILIAKHSGWMDLPTSSGNFMSIGSIIELLLMTAGITQQFYRYKKEKELMLLAYLEQQKQITTKILLTEEAERKRIARELHDDIGAGLTRITLMSDAARNKTNVSVKEIEEIAQTCRRLVGNMGEIVWSLDPENNTLGLLMAYMREELHKLLEYSGIEYNLQLPESNTLVELSNEQRRNLLLVTKEVVHNAVKYSGANHIKIGGTFFNRTLELIVTDNGSGFDENTVRKGNGLRNIRQRIQEIGGTFALRSGEGTGTTVQYSVVII
jgi:signal transduction histidine kinase